MKKLTLAFLFIAFSCGTLFGQETVWFEGTFDQAQKAASKQGKLLLVDFYSDG